MAKLKATSVTGDLVVSGKAHVGGNSNWPAPAISLAIGDNDTGFNSNYDGKLEYWCNNERKFDMSDVYHTGRPPEVLTSTRRFSPAYHFENGVLIDFEVPAWEATMITIRLTGNDYKPFGLGTGIDTTYCFYRYGGNGFVQEGALANGEAHTMKIFVHEDKIKAWVCQNSMYQTLSLEVTIGNPINTPYAIQNMKISHSPVPEDATELVEIVPNQAYSTVRKPTATEINAMEKKRVGEVFLEGENPTPGGTNSFIITLPVPAQGDSSGTFLLYLSGNWHYSAIAGCDCYAISYVAAGPQPALQSFKLVPLFDVTNNSPFTLGRARRDEYGFHIDVHFNGGANGVYVDVSHIYGNVLELINEIRISAPFRGEVLDRHKNYTSVSKPTPQEIEAVPVSDYSLTVINKTLQVGTEWMDTGIAGIDLETGSYMVQLSNIPETPTLMFQEVFTGVMSWFSDSTNSTEADEIILTKAGHAPNGNHLYLRVLRHSYQQAPYCCSLQICANGAFTSATNITFKFRKLI